MSEDIEGPHDEPRGRLNVDRRTFLVGTGLVAAAAVQYSELLTGSELTNALAGPTGLPSLTRMLRRREDFLNLRFDFYNLVRDTRAGAKPQLIRKLSTRPAYVVVTFPPQSLVETTYPANAADPTTRPVRNFLAAPSRLGFSLPPATTAIPFTVDGLLSWIGWEPAVVTTANTYTLFLRPVPEEPAAWQTALEMPWGMILSPGSSQTWAHETQPVTHNGRTELWHTRLANRRFGVSGPGAIDERNTPDRTIRSVWAVPHLFPGEVLPGNLDPTLNFPIPNADRATLTDQMSDQRNSASRPAHANKLMLSALGGWLDIDGSWPKPYSKALWRHVSTMGRDHYVKVVTRGFLYPFGHPAVFIATTERKLSPRNNPMSGYLRKTLQILVVDPVVEYGAGASHPNVSALRRFPFRRIEMLTTATPPLTSPAENAFGTPTVTVAGVTSPVLFDLAFTDLDGNESRVSMPLVFNPQTPPPATEPDPENYQSGLLVGTFEQMAQAFTVAQNSAFGSQPGHLSGSVPLNGQRVTFAPPSAEHPDRSTFATRAIRFGAVTAAAGGDGWKDTAAETVRPAVDLVSGTPAFAAVVDTARVQVDALAAIQGADATVDIRHAASFVKLRGAADSVVEAGFDVLNQGGTFAEYVDAGGAAKTLASNLAGEAAGGLTNLDLKLAGLSRDLGPVGDLKNLAEFGTYDPSLYLEALSAKLLGAVKLTDLIPTTGGKAPAATAPRIVTDLEYPNGDRTKLPIASLTKLDWTPGAKTVEPAFFVTPGSTKFEIHGLIHTDFQDPTRTTTRFWGLLTDVTVKLFGNSPFMIIPVRRVAFEAKTGAKTSFDIDLGEITFGEPLTFVTELAKLLRFGGAGGPYVDVTTAGVNAGVNVMLPNIQLGSFQLSNVAFSVAAHLPFNGEFSVDFSFCSREHPSTLTVSCFGGGAWVTIAIGVAGISKLDVGFELGAAVSLNLGVASAEVHVFAGIYLTIEKGKNPEAQMGGYLRVGGTACVLGVVTVSIEIQLDIRLDPENLKAVAKGNLHLEVDIFMVTKSFDVEIEKRFGATAKDPGFKDQVNTQAAWDDYCDAFATIGS